MIGTMLLHYRILKLLGRGTKTRLTFDPASDIQPAWSPTGDQITFTSTRSGIWDIFTQAADGSSAAQPLVTGLLPDVGPNWSRDMHYLVYFVIDPKTRRDLWYVPLTGERKPVPFSQTHSTPLLAHSAPAP